MAYFNPNQPPDRSLLHSSVRDHGELSHVAKQAERDVIARFTERLGPTTLTSAQVEPYRYTTGDQRFRVNLAGYHADPAEADGYDADRGQWTGLAAALRLAIARVTSHRLRHYDQDEDVVSESRGERRVEYREGKVDPLWPNGWRSSLDLYSIEEVAFHI